MVIISKERAELNIWPKTSKQAKNTEDIIRTLWGKEVYYRWKASGTKMHLLLSSSKEARYVYLFFWYDYETANLGIDFRFDHEL